MNAVSKGRLTIAAAIAVVFCALALSFSVHASNAFADESTDLTTGSSVSLTTQAATPSVTYCTHVQTYGWQGWKSNGEMSGTSGQSKRLEGIEIKLQNANGGIEYKTHVQTYGWQDWKSNGTMSGTTGQSKRLEGIQIRLTGAIANDYDILYRVHVQTYGWQDWVKNGETAGTTGQSKRLEAIEIRLVKKGTAPSMSYSAHVQSYGWQSAVAAGKTAGTTGESKRVEAYKVNLNPGSYAGGIQYSAHVQSIGWQDYVKVGEVSGTTGRSLRVEAIRMKLTGDLANNYDIYYRVHVQSGGWTGWAKNGASAGSQGYSKRAEAFEAVLVKKGGSAPGSTDNTMFSFEKKRLDGIDIASWQAGINIANTNADFVIVKATEGVNYINPYFKQHADATIASGKLLGIYHFAVVGDAEKQADYFVNAIGPYVGRAALFLDWENTSYSATLLQGPAWAKKFMDRVYERTGVRPLIYMSQSVTNDYNWSSVAPTYGLWMARYLYRNMNTGFLDSPDGGDGYSYWSSLKLYQYSSTGSISGYSGSLDLDKFYGTSDDWKKLQAKQ
ncbi:MAG: hypothetical protein IJ111_07355 [Eggerthellaceae bacterium]|nr:hypothetical protein [Eggerthellaceae bacterium]